MNLPPIAVYQSLAASTTLTITKQYDHGIIVTLMNIKFNSGCQDLLQYYVTLNGQNLFEFQSSSGASGGYLCGDNETLFWQGWLQFLQPPNKITITIVNTDTYTHMVKFLLDVQKAL